MDHLNQSLLLVDEVAGRVCLGKSFFQSLSRFRPLTNRSSWF
jgi:hypothetical protein